MTLETLTSFSSILHCNSCRLNIAILLKMSEKKGKVTKDQKTLISA